MNPELIFLLIAIVFLFLGIKTKRSTFIAYGKKVEGTIIGNKHSRASGGSGVYYPIVLFVTENNISISQELSSGHYPAKKRVKKLD